MGSTGSRGESCELSTAQLWLAVGVAHLATLEQKDKRAECTKMHRWLCEIVKQQPRERPRRRNQRQVNPAVGRAQVGGEADATALEHLLHRQLEGDQRDEREDEGPV